MPGNVATYFEKYRKKPVDKSNIENTPHLINAYFYNTHDLRLQIKYSRECGRPWNALKIIYTTKYYPKTIEIEIPNDLLMFNLPLEFNDSYGEYPIKAIVVPYKGRNNKNETRPITDFYKIGVTQLAW